MPQRRILSLWFPRLAAERCLRDMRGLPAGPFAIVGDQGNAQVLVSLSAEAEAAGLTCGQPLRDAHAMCPDLQTRLENRELNRLFLTVLRRWAGKFSPWVAEEAPGGLVIDLTGCAHLFGGEAELMGVVEADCADLGLTVRTGLADTVGAAWALARFAGRGQGTARSGDDIMQEARATRSRAAKRRHWERGGPAPGTQTPGNHTGRIAVPGQPRTALSPLPIAALRIAPDLVATLNRLGLRQISDLAGQPRAALARRFGRALVQRLDQALGVEPEPITPVRAPDHFAVRLTLPDPIGLTEDILAALDRLLPPLSGKLENAGRGVRAIRMEYHRSDHTMGSVEARLARPSANPDRIRPLLAMKTDDIDPGFGIDMIRLEAVPEKTTKMMAAAWSEPAKLWPKPLGPRPIELWRPELVAAEESQHLPAHFRWRNRDFETYTGLGPERISPEWWLDDPDWRTGVRDYWRVTTRTGERLWIYYAHGGTMSPGWFCHGSFC